MKKLNCLHISNDFTGSKVHTTLYKYLKEANIKQTVFYPNRTNDDTFNVDTINELEIKLIKSRPFKKSYKFLFHKRKSDFFNDIQSQISLKDIDVILATTLFADGAIALKINKKYGIPYAVAIRGTDFAYFRLRKDLTLEVIQILLRSEKIIFISKVIEKKFKKLLLVKLIEKKISHKYQLIFNGIDDMWINNTHKRRKLEPNKILYIGRFDKNKNVLNLVHGFLELKKQNPRLILTLIGRKGEQEEKIKELARINSESIIFLGPIYDKEKLMDIFLQNHIFAMVSRSESFGLVYIEALSQGLPVLCTSEQGIDGLFNIPIGEFVNPYNTKSIANGLNDIIQNYNSYRPEKIDYSVFKWHHISSEYLKLFYSIIK